jgi:predicted DCC family thiol-disulfide oxidoreductase YuxK
LKVELFYDDECPFCKEYSKFVEIRKKHDISIQNARDSLDKIVKFRDQGYDINKGMIVLIDDTKIYQGAQAAKVLDELIESKNIVDKLISLVVKMPGFKSIVYPIVLWIRRIVLKLTRKNPDIKY